jgi:hypothetical protein
MWVLTIVKTTMVFFEAVFVETVKQTPQKYKFPAVLPNFVFERGKFGMAGINKTTPLFNCG